MGGMHRLVKAYLHGKEAILTVQFVEDHEPAYVAIDSLPYDESNYPRHILFADLSQALSMGGRLICFARFLEDAYGMFQCPVLIRMTAQTA